MARRRRRDREGNYDSVLDTMTNVVGILVIVVAVTQMSVGDAVRTSVRDREALPEVSPETLEAMRARAGELETTLARLRADWGKLEATLPDRRIELARADERIRELRAKVEETAR